MQFIAMNHSVDFEIGFKFGEKLPFYLPAKTEHIAHTGTFSALKCFAIATHQSTIFLTILCELNDNIRI